MLPEIKQLLVIQDRDQKIARLEKELKRIPLEENQANERLDDDKAAVTAAQEAFASNEVTTNKFQLDAQTRRDTITKLKTQQFETRKNEEYRAFGNEIERYEKEISTLEDQELELMEQGEQLKATLTKANAGLTSTQKLVDEELAQLAQRKKSCESQIADLKTERDTLGQDIETELLDQYDRLLKNKKDGVVVPLNHGICGGCHMKVTSATFHSVKASMAITQCENCGRILYLGET